MYVLFNRRTNKILAAGDRIDCIRRAMFSLPFGEHPGALEQLSQRIDMLEQTLSALLATLSDDQINSLLRMADQVIYDDSTKP